MFFAELLLIAVGLSMDAFAVSVCKGLSLRKVQWRHMITAGLWFGVFQAAMPLLGYLLGINFRSFIESIDHWIAFTLLALIGFNMIREALSEDDEDNNDEDNNDDDNEKSASFGYKVMLPLAVATSIDAFAVGITFSFLNEAIIPAVLTIGATTFLFSAAGVIIGNMFGTRFRSKAEIAGGIVLILIGLKILLEHTGCLPFR